MTTPEPLRTLPGLKLLPPLSLLKMKPEEDIIKEKLLTLNIPEDVIIRIADKITASKPPQPIGISKEEYDKLTLEQKRYNKLPILSSTDPYHIITVELRTLFKSLKQTSGDDVMQLYEQLRTEQTIQPKIEFSIVCSPLSERLIAHVTALEWNGVDLLKGQKIMLYKSTGESRGTGLGGYWMPYLGERYNKVVAKLEDDYFKALESILVFSIPIPDNYKPILVDIINNIFTYNYYKRFINKQHLIASFLLLSTSDAYIENPSNSKYIRSYTDEEKANALKNIGSKILHILKNDPYTDYIPITAEIIDEIIQPSLEGAGDKYFMKYLKFKMKYLYLKKQL